MDRPKDIPHWAWDMAVEAADAASGPMGAIWGHEQGAPAIAKFIIQARSQAFEESIAAADILLDGYASNDPERYGVLAALDAIRQHSQKGRDYDGK